MKTTTKPTITRSKLERLPLVTLRTLAQGLGYDLDQHTHTRWTRKAIAAILMAGTQAPHSHHTEKQILDLLAVLLSPEPPTKPTTPDQTDDAQPSWSWTEAAEAYAQVTGKNPTGRTFGELVEATEQALVTAGLASYEVGGKTVDAQIRENLGLPAKPTTHDQTGTASAPSDEEAEQIRQHAHNKLGAEQRIESTLQDYADDAYPDGVMVDGVRYLVGVLVQLEEEEIPTDEQIEAALVDQGDLPSPVKPEKADQTEVDRGPALQCNLDEIRSLLFSLPSERHLNAALLAQLKAGTLSEDAFLDYLEMTQGDIENALAAD